MRNPRVLCNIRGNSPSCLCLIIHSVSCYISMDMFTPITIYGHVHLSSLSLYRHSSCRRALMLCLRGNSLVICRSIVVNTSQTRLSLATESQSSAYTPSGSLESTPRLVRVCLASRLVRVCLASRLVHVCLASSPDTQDA